MLIVNPEVERYLYDLAPPRDPILIEMERLGDTLRFPIVGPLVGRLLYQMALLVGAKRILELGSGFGYSAYWFALALPEDGQVICTDSSPEHARQARNFFRRGGLESKLRFEVGNALEIIDGIAGQFDIIFNDIDKEQYPEAFHKAVPRLRKGGLLITDNMLWGGSVISGDSRASVRGVISYTRMLYSAEDLFTTIIPLRDGVSISVKL